MRIPRVRPTVGRLMVGLAIATLAETIMARWAVSTARDDDGFYDWSEATLYWVLLHIPLVFVAGLMWVGYHAEQEPDSTESESG